MSYSITAYVVDLDALRKVFGSEDRKLLARMKKKFGEEFSDNAETFEDEITAGAPTLFEAVEEILQGKPKARKHGFQYGYAIELICAALGKNLFAAEYAGPEFFDRLPKLVGDKAARKLLDADRVTENPRKLVLPIPRPSDFPGVNSFEAAECRQILGWLGKIKPEALDLVEGEDDALEELLGWFNKAVKAKKGLVTFFY